MSGVKMNLRVPSCATSRTVVPDSKDYRIETNVPILALVGVGADINSFGHTESEKTLR